MALKGSYDFKGINISEAYLQVCSFNYFLDHSYESSVKTPAVMEADGLTIKTEAVYESNWVKKPKTECLIKVFKDKAKRDLEPFSSIEDFVFKLTLSIADSAKNPIKQAYTALKADDRFKDYTDV